MWEWAIKISALLYEPIPPPIPQCHPLMTVGKYGMLWVLINTYKFAEDTISIRVLVSPKLKNRTNILFFKKFGGEHEIRRVQRDKRGFLSNFPIKKKKSIVLWNKILYSFYCFHLFYKIVRQISPILYLCCVCVFVCVLMLPVATFFSSTFIFFR